MVMKNMSDKKSIIDKEKDNLFAIYCDFYSTSRSRLASGGSIISMVP